MNSRTLRASGIEGAEAPEIPQNTYPWTALGTVCDFLEGKWGVTVAPRGSGGGIAGTPWRRRYVKLRTFRAPGAPRAPVPT